MKLQLKITLGDVGISPDPAHRPNSYTTGHLIENKKLGTQLILLWGKRGWVDIYPSIESINKNAVIYNKIQYDQSYDKYFKRFPDNIKDFCVAILTGEKQLTDPVPMEIKQ